MLSKLAYLTLYRSIQLLVLLARGDAATDMEILVLRTSSWSSAARPHVPSGARRSGAARRAQPRPATVSLVVLPR
jgi:hypothetical protein